MNENEFYWYWLNNISYIGRKGIKNLLDFYDSPKEIYHLAEKEISLLLKDEKKIFAWKESKNERIILNSYQKLKKKNIHFIFWGCNNYPERLKNIPDPPYALYLKGQLPSDENKTVAIIGARNCTRYGKEMARYFGRELAKNGISIISGLARGVDGMAHYGALEGKGYTLGVIGGGIDRIYPQENYPLYLKMEEQGGIISENNIGVKPVSGLFPQRNRLIAGFADAILVIEAMEKSGTFITVDQGLEQGKDILAIPGKILDEKSVGCNNLIKYGAHMVTEINDVFDVLQVEPNTDIMMKETNNFEKLINKMSLAPHEKMVYSCLQIEPKYFDDIIKEVKLSPQEVYDILYKLILRGIITETMKNYYAINL